MTVAFIGMLLCLQILMSVLAAMCALKDAEDRLFEEKQ